MKISVTTYPWGKLKDTESFERILDSVEKIGFEGIGIEFSLLPSEVMKNPKLLPDMLRKRGLANGGTFSPCSEYVLSWASASKTPLMWVAAKAKGDRAAISMLKSYAKKSLKSGVLSALHNELRSSFQTQDQIERALNTIPELALCYDTAHADGAGMNVNEVFEKYKTRLALVHLKDLREKLPKSLIRFRRDFVNVGKGVVDLRSIVSELYSIKYKGQLMLEIEALEGQDPESAVREGYDYIQKIL